VGRGGWSWYTGSAAWFYRFGLEGLLGLERVGDELRVTPRVPPEWPGFEVRYRYGASSYVLRAKRVDAPPAVGDGAAPGARGWPGWAQPTTGHTPGCCACWIASARTSGRRARSIPAGTPC